VLRSAAAVLAVTLMLNKAGFTGQIARQSIDSADFCEFPYDAG